MDTELLRTFLEVNRTRHFGQAAEHLCLTQSAVSARIRQLEQTLGVALFTRVRNNVQLTPQGERLVRHAEAMLNTWTRARQEIALAAVSKASLAVGAVPGLWDILLQDWLLSLAAAHPQLSITAETHPAQLLLRRVRERTLDLAFAFEQMETYIDIDEEDLFRIYALATTHAEQRGAHVPCLRKRCERKATA